MLSKPTCKRFDDHVGVNCVEVTLSKTIVQNTL